jgi:hypothetical protein
MKALRVAIAIGIALLVPLLAHMTVQIWHEPPERDLDAVYLEATGNTPEERAQASQQRREAQERYEEELKLFNQASFKITFPMGIIGVVAAYLLRRRATLAAGFFFGSLCTITFSSYASWDHLPGTVRYVTLLFTLALLSVLALLADRESRVDSPPI